MEVAAEVVLRCENYVQAQASSLHERGRDSCFVLQTVIYKGLYGM